MPYRRFSREWWTESALDLVRVLLVTFVVGMPVVIILAAAGVLPWR